MKGLDNKTIAILLIIALVIPYIPFIRGFGIISTVLILIGIIGLLVK